MARALTKICGLKTPETVEVALGSGAAFLGFMTFERSLRHLSPSAARDLCAALNGRAKSVSVLVDPDDALIETVLRDFGPDMIQLHGHECPERCAYIRARGVGVIKAYGVSSKEDLVKSSHYEGAVDYHLFDAKPPKGAPTPGGLGTAFDWTLLQGFSCPTPWFLSGGLTPYNVREAVSISGAGFVDVSSGVESAPGVKDAALITRFLDALSDNQPRLTA